MDRRATIRRWLALREREGLTNAQLAARSGVNASTLAHWAWRLCRESRRRSDDAFVELVPAADDVGLPHHRVARTAACKCTLRIRRTRH